MHTGPARLMIAAPSRGSGKSTISIGLAAALRGRGRSVQTFKKGPDFIDPMWLSAASGRGCRNLDFFMMGRERIAAVFPARAGGCDLALVEANHGLHDGTDPAGADSGAALATLLGLPVVLVVNAQRLGRGVAPLVQGQVAFDPAVRVAGVVLNRVRGRRHEGKLRDAIERYCRVEVLGVLPDLPELAITERHLGLTPLDEVPDLAPIVGRIGDAVAQHLDLDRLESIARTAPPLHAVGDDEVVFDTKDGAGEGVARRGGRNGAGPGTSTGAAEGWREAGAPGGAQRLASTDGGAQRQDPAAGDGVAHGTVPRRVRIGVAMDRAFTFYYPENLEALVAAGAELIPFSPLDDPRLPPVEGLYLGGGFPEVFMERLEANVAMREQVRRAILDGVPAWAECGGLMYLTRGIAWGARTAAMAGVFDCSVQMEDRPAGHGYVLLEGTGAGAWPHAGQRLRGHEFHHSRLVGLPAGSPFGYRVLRGNGASAGFDGLVSGACVAAYTHLHADGAPTWAADFVQLVRERGRAAGA
jgi:cobyrinic acid a,c-diamide synthase